MSNADVMFEETINEIKKRVKVRNHRMGGAYSKENILLMAQVRARRIALLRNPPPPTLQRRKKVNQWALNCRSQLQRVQAPV